MLRIEESSLLFVTSNTGKATSANATLREFGFYVAQLRNIIDEPYHTKSPLLIAREKIFAAERVVSSHGIGLPIICEDSGFFVNALNGLPGVKINEFLKTKGISGLLKDLEGKKDRSAYFWEVLAYKEPGMAEPIYFESKPKGHITTEERGEIQSHNWSSLHLVFILEGYTKTWAQMNLQEYKDYDLRKNSRWDQLGYFLRQKNSVRTEDVSKLKSRSLA